MPVVSVEVTKDALCLPPGVVEQLGLRPGERARLEIRHVPDAEAIRMAALRYACRRLGDAVGVEEPERDGEWWIVGLKVQGRKGTFGQLVLTDLGDVLLDRSTSRDELLCKLNAESPAPQAS